MLEYRLDLIEFFLKYEKSGLFEDLYHVLDSGDYYLKLSYAAPSVDYDAVIPFGYFYNNKFIGNLKDFKKIYPEQPKYVHFKENHILEELTIIQNILKQLYKQAKFFKELNNIHSHHESLYQPQVTPWGDEINFGGWIEFKFEGLLLISYEEDDSYGDEDPLSMKDLTKILPKIHHQSIQNQVWFSSLEPETRKLVKASESLLLSINFDSYRTGDYDYAPLLLDLFKAIEVEFMAHYQYHAKNILDLAKRVIALSGDSESDQGSKNVSALALMRSIINFQTKFRTSGITSPFKILYYLGLGESVRWGEEGFESYLNNKQYELIVRQKDVILDMQQLGERRNNFVHEGILIDDNLLNKYQSNAIITLRLLAEIKDYNMLSSSERFDS
jgi:hypothetical protein